MLRGNCLNAKLNIGQVRTLTMDRDSGSDESCREPGLSWPRPNGGPSAPGTQNAVLSLLLREPAASSFLFLSFWQNQVLRHLGRKLFMCQYFKGILLCEGEKEARGEANIKTNLSRDGFFFFLRLKSVYRSSHPFSPSSFMMLLRCPFQHNIFKRSKPWGSSWRLAVMKYI